MRYVSQGMGLLLSMGLVSSSWAIGGANVSNEVPSARSAGQGYVGVAGQNEDPSVAWSNSGGITQLPGTQLTVGGHLENLHGSYQTDAGAETKTRNTNVVVPNLSLTHLFNDGQVGLGLSIQSPYGLETHWGGDSPLRYVATDSRLAVTFISPSVALKVTPAVSVGAGFDFVDLSNAQLDRHVNVNDVNTAFGAPTTTASDANASIKGDGTSWGGHAGVVYKPMEQHSFGLTYHSKVTIPVEGTIKLSGLSGASAAVFGSNYQTAAETNVQVPENVQLGYAYKPTSKWLFEVDAAWLHWSDYQSLNVTYKESDRNKLAVLNTGNPTVLDLRDAWSFSTGTNYKFNDRWQFRTGFWFEPRAQQESAFTPAYEDLTRYGFSWGTGFAVTPSFIIDLAYSAEFAHTREIHNSVGTNATGDPRADISGTYKGHSNLFALNLTYKWGK